MARKVPGARTAALLIMLLLLPSLLANLSVGPAKAAQGNPRIVKT